MGVVRMSAERGFPSGVVLGLAAAAAVTGGALLHLDRLPVTVCMFKRITGVPCATCGSTRAMVRLVHLDLAGALAMNPLAVAAAALAALWCVADLLLLTRGRALAVDLTPRESRLVQAGVVAALLINWAYVIAAGR